MSWMRQRAMPILQDGPGVAGAGLGLGLEGLGQTFLFAGAQQVVDGGGGHGAHAGLAAAAGDGGDLDLAELFIVSKCVMAETDAADETATCGAGSKLAVL